MTEQPPELPDSGQTSTGQTSTTTEPPPPAGPRVHRDQMRDLSRLRRSTSDKKIAGVAGGLGRHLDIDPTVIRVVLVVLTLFGGAGLVLYAAAWLLIPEDGAETAPIETTESTRSALLIGAGVFAALLLLGNTWFGGWGGLGFGWPLGVIAIAAVLVYMNRDKASSSSRDAATAQAEQGQANQHLGWSPADAQYTSSEYTSSEYTYPLPEPAPKAYRGPRLFWPTLALVAVALGMLGVYDASGADVTEAAYPALALAVVGAMLVAGAWFGRPGGLIFLGVVASIALAFASLVPDNVGREIHMTPQRAAELDQNYSTGAGVIDIDLTEIEDLDALDGRSLSLEAAAGQIELVVPDGLDVDLHTEVGFGGETRILNEVRNGNDFTMDRLIDGGADVPRLDVDIEVVAGAIEVRQQ